jgi:hypothetical protein
MRHPRTETSEPLQQRFLDNVVRVAEVLQVHFVVTFSRQLVTHRPAFVDINISKGRLQYEGLRSKKLCGIELNDASDKLRSIESLVSGSRRIKKLRGDYSAVGSRSIAFSLRWSRGRGLRLKIQNVPFFFLAC